MRTVRPQLSACLLFAAGGIIEGYSYCGCDGVFANVQTVNLLFVGMSFAQANWKNVLRYGVPIVAYCLGIAVFILYRNWYQKSESRLQVMLPFVCKELLVLASMLFPPMLASFSLSAACGFGIEEYTYTEKEDADMGAWFSPSNLIILLSFVCGIIAGIPLFAWLRSLTLFIPAFLLLGVVIAQQNASSW